LIPFPEAKRVIYKTNPIVELICEFRFPRILKINENEPVEFQERIRTKYPINKITSGHQGQVTIEMSNNTVDAPLPRFSHSEEKIKNHQFFSADNTLMVNLNSTSLSIATQKYEKWEKFSPQINEVLGIFVDIYKPAFYERIGLKYVDAIQKSKLNLNNKTPWGKLVKPHTAGYFANKELAQFVKNYMSTVEIDIDEGAVAQIRTFLAHVTDMKKTIPVGPSEIAFIIISDLFFLRKDLENAAKSVDYLHSVAYRLLRSIITDKLHNAMGLQKYDNTNTTAKNVYRRIRTKYAVYKNQHKF
jgi:uncharacterized protein (TIGR04255 family)